MVLKYAKSLMHGLKTAKTLDKIDNDRFYSGQRWRDLRARFLRHNPMCADCKRQGRDEPADTVHHIRERLEYPELAYEWSNLEGTCRACHNRRHKAKGKPVPRYGR